MLDSAVIHELRKLSDGLTLLYVEDNDGLREKALNVLKKLFTNIISASDGEEGYRLFKEHHPQIVISDISMPKLDGLQMIKQIKQTQPSTKFIITSAYDDKEYLFQAIEAGVFHYMKKPIKIDQLASTLMKCINTINLEDNSSVFNTYMDDMINHQTDMSALMSNNDPLFVNQMFLDFFNVESIDDFSDKYSDFGSLLLEHKGFLYNHDDINWFSEASKEADKLFHVKIADKEGANRHFILKVHPIPKKKHIYIMSLNDITDLNLLSLFDSKAVKNDEKLRSKSTILNLMKVIQENNAEIKIHNYYKGLTITNLGLILHVEDEHIIIKTSFMQEKAVQYQNSILITSAILPSAIFCETVQKIDFENQTIMFKDLRFMQSNPTQRTTVRVCPEEHHTVSLFYEERKFYGEVRIYDVSVTAVKLELNAFPAGLKIGENVVVNMVLEQDKKPTIVQSPAKLIRIDEIGRSFFLILIFDIDVKNKKTLINYVAKRQMNLIHEFKGLQFA